MGVIPCLLPLPVKNGSYSCAMCTVTLQLRGQENPILQRDGTVREWCNEELIPPWCEKHHLTRVSGVISDKHFSSSQGVFTVAIDLCFFRVETLRSVVKHKTGCLATVIWSKCLCIMWLGPPHQRIARIWSAVWRWCHHSSKAHTLLALPAYL